MHLDPVERSLPRSAASPPHALREGGEPGALPPGGGGLYALGSVSLDPSRRAKLRHAEALASGDPVWRVRKLQEAHDLHALSQVAPPGRLEVGLLDLRDCFRAVVHLGVPVPIWDEARSDIRLGRRVTLGLTYPREALSLPQPGFVFFQTLLPQGVFLPNVGRPPSQPVCLGPTLPAGIRVRSLLLLAYSVFTMQSVQVNELDAAGVFNPIAARWWQRNLTRAPLSRLAFLAPESPGGDAMPQERSQ